MNLSHVNQWQLKLDDWRVRQHFKRVEATLCARDVSHLSPSLQQARQYYLDQLHAYAARGIFPRNYERPGYAPCFIDRDGRECAVAHLVMASGQADFAHHIAAVANYAYVPQMTFPELDDWGAQVGLSREEMALIQPGYYMTFTSSLLVVAITAWVAGLLTILINALQIARKRIGIVVPVIGLILVLFLLLLSIYCFYGLAEANAVATNLDTPQTLRNLAHIEVDNFSIPTLISLAVTLLTGGLSVYRMHAFLDARSRNRQ